jgi:hypothetical protein
VSRLGLGAIGHSDLLDATAMQSRAREQATLIRNPQRQDPNA